MINSRTKIAGFGRTDALMKNTSLIGPWTIRKGFKFSKGVCFVFTVKAEGKLLEEIRMGFE